MKFKYHSVQSSLNTLPHVSELIEEVAVLDVYDIDDYLKIDLHSTNIDSYTSIICLCKMRPRKDQDSDSHQ